MTLKYHSSLSGSSKKKVKKENLKSAGDVPTTEINNIMRFQKMNCDRDYIII